MLVRIPFRTTPGRRCMCFRSSRKRSIWMSLPTELWRPCRCPVRVRRRLRADDAVQVMRVDALSRVTPRRGASSPWVRGRDFVFSKNGRYLYGSSYFTGVSKSFATTSRGGARAVSNAELGFFRPLPLADSKLMCLRYTALGLRRHHRGETDRGFERGHFSRRTGASAYPIVRPGRRRPSTIPTRLRSLVAVQSGPCASCRSNR